MTDATEVTRPDLDAEPPPSPAPGPGTVTAVSASTVRFVLLIAAVVATSGFIFLSIHTALPSRASILHETVSRCAAAQAADPDYGAPNLTIEDSRRAEAVSRRLQDCLNPVLVDIAGFVLGGFAVLVGLTGVLYLTHPYGIVRRRRLKRLSAETSGRLVGELEQLRREMGLSRSPDWRLAPFARTTGGQAFGLPWHRYVQIDAGLAILQITNRPAFRAVVLHELAHLRNRDVDKTYLTISVWRAFLAVGLLPYVVLLLHPGVLQAPLHWRWQEIAFIANPASGAFRIGSLLVLTALVYLTRNAILRVRETHADATAVAHDGAGSALPALLARLPAPTPRWWHRWGTHPRPQQRLATVRDPRLLLTAGLWELVGVGIATGLVCKTGSLLVGIHYPLDPLLGITVLGLVISPLAVVLLVAAIWRATARDPAGPISARTWLAGPVVLVAGYVAGTFLTLDGASTFAASNGSVSLVSRLVSTLVLTTGAVFLAAWIASATRGVLTRPDRPTWTMPAMVAVAVVVGATWFAIWLPFSLMESGFADGWGPPPGTGLAIDWYTTVAAVTGAGFGPMAWFVYNPLTLPGLTLLWLVPVLVGARRRAMASSLRFALIAGLVGTACVAAIGAALPFAAEAALPADVRRTTDADGVAFVLLYTNTMLALGAVVVAVVMAVVVARRGPHRPALALLAGWVTTALSTWVMSFGTDPIACYANVWEAVPAPTHCLGVADVAALSQTAHWMLLQAFLVAVPAMLVAAGAGAAYRRWRAPGRSLRSPDSPPGPAAAPPRWRPATFAVVAFLTALVGVSAWFTVLTLPRAYQAWLERSLG